MKKVIAASIIAIIAVAAVVGITNAKTSGEQTQNQKVTTSTKQTCEQTGEYGNQKCVNQTNTTVEQSESQKLSEDKVYGSVRGSRVHYPADTALDMIATLQIIGLGIVGVGASVALQKIA